MSSKKKSTTKKPSTPEATEQMRKAAIAEIDARLDGKPKPRAKMSASVARAAPEGAAKTKAAQASAKTMKKPKAAKPTKEKRLSGLDLAAQIVAKSKEPLNAKTIAERVIAAGWKTKGKTPSATLYAAVLREIAAKGKDARFKKVDRGLFAAGKGA